MPKVSVIVPVYNTELYVERAITSLMEQTLSDVEFIILDDGSKDNSLSIINKVLSRHPERQSQTTLISRENRGVTATRTQGMSLATGDYIIHLDSDDWAEPDWLEKLYKKAIDDNADVVICNYSVILKNRTKKIQQNTSPAGKECVKLLLSGKISNANWNKLISHRLISNKKIKYNQEIGMGEDFLFSLETLFFAKKVSHVNENLYNYNTINANSLTRIYSEKSLQNLLQTVEYTKNFFSRSCRDPELSKHIDYYKISVRSCFVISTNGNPRHIKTGVKLYPETNSLLWKSKNHWALKISIILFYAKLDFMTQKLYKILLLFSNRNNNLH